MPKVLQNTFGGRAVPGPAGAALPRSPSHSGGLLLRGGEGKEGREERGMKRWEGKNELHLTLF